MSVIGLGRFGGGVGAVRFLAERGAAVTVSDRASEAELAESLDQIADLDVVLHLGGHCEGDFLAAETLVVSPAVPPDLPALQAARSAGVEITSEMDLFLERCPCPIAGITGSVGKSTTTAMAAAVLATTHTTHLGGNIGRSLLPDLPTIQPTDRVVLELSSFQLEAAASLGVSPAIALVTNLQPNHLDRHGTMAAYEAAKKNIFRFQRPGDLLLLPAGDESLAPWAAEAPGRVDVFPTSPAPADAFDLLVPGLHNQANAQAAWAIAAACGVPRDRAAAALAAFPGLPHRLQFVAEVGGVRFYNDSKCTTPAGSRVALAAFGPDETGPRAILLAGGSDKGTPFAPLAEAAAHAAKAVLTFGQTGPAIADACRATCEPDRVATFPDLPAAFAEARRRAESGDVVLLSPACASYDQFPNYEHRGRAFCDLIAASAGSSNLAGSG